MFSFDEYSNLKNKYGSYASWAIWNDKKPNDTVIIEKNIGQLHSKFILLGLNISRPLTIPWSNFHDNTHARKLRFACNDSMLRGSYMTDIFKGIIEPKSLKFKNSLTDNVIRKNIDFFNQEMKDIKITNDSQFIIFGSLAAKYFGGYFKQNYNNLIVYCRHYSDYSVTDREWVDEFRKNLLTNI